MFNTSISVLLLLVFPAVISEVVDFSKCSEFFFEGKSPNITGMLVKSQSQNNQYKTICQKYKNAYRFATLYDTTNRIPVFSAYTVTVDKEIKRPENTWMNEPQQARKQDYMINNAHNYIPGALFPTSHTADKYTVLSTFTLTNSVPQNNRFKESIWNLVETEMKTNMDSYCHDNNKKTLSYVLTGVIPGDQQLNERVNIPSHVWTAFCCFYSSANVCVSKTYYTTNQRHNNVINIRLMNLGDLETFLNERLGGGINLFDGKCSKK
ncbi:hypothetical protein IRJ41_024233 [Triplophysa rosa]|uniref:Endonuclease domain-containing 1 protein n=1 Tax=Triplophysa rosa TaxID=992332 RepID=A0A9W7T5F4_TRIRA|nr:hypothetical protein IRJ41_024233 [Triplophysa rosa]